MSRKIAFSGILTALTVVLLYFAAVAPTGKLAAYTLCSIPIAIAIIEFKTGSGIMVYAAASILAFLLLGRLDAIAPFVLFFGHYGIFKFHIEKCRSAVLEIVLKLALFNLSLGAAYYAYTKLFGVSAIWLEGLGWIGVTMFLTAAQVVFLIYDYVFSRVIDFYQQKRHLIWNKSN